MLLVFGAVLGVQAEDFVYQNDFSSAEGLTIVGDGSFVDNDRFGKVFQNLASTTPRSNYLLLPADLLSHSVESKALTIGFWVSAENAGESAAYGWAPLFTAYEKKNSPNSWPMMALQYRGVTQVNCAGWTDNVDAQNVKGVNTLYHFDSDWLADKEWHYYTAVFEGESCKVYFDGELKNEWNVALVADRTQQGLFSNGADLKYICWAQSPIPNPQSPIPILKYKSFIFKQQLKIRRQADRNICRHNNRHAISARAPKHPHRLPPLPLMMTMTPLTPSAP